MEFVIATVLAIAGILVAYRTLRNQNRGKFVRLHYTSTAIPFVMPNVHTDRLVKVRSGGRELIHPMLVVVRLDNTGQAPITPADFAGPLRIKFGQYAIFTAGVMRWNRDDVIDHNGDPVSMDRGDLVFKPMLLNPRDQLTLIAIVDGIADDVKVTTRIAGVESVDRITPLHDGFISRVEARSLIYEFQDECPAQVPLEATLYVGPLTINPDSEFDEGPEVYVGGSRATKASHIALTLVNVTDRVVNTFKGDEPLVVDLGEARTVHCSRFSRRGGAG